MQRRRIPRAEQPGYGDVSLISRTRTLRKAAIRSNLRHLLWRLWGTADTVEVDAAWSGPDANPEEDEYCPVRDLDPSDGIDITLNWSDISNSEWVAASKPSIEYH